LFSYQGIYQMEKNKPGFPGLDYLVRPLKKSFSSSV